MLKTENFKLKKPERSVDFVRIDDLNDNMDVIDRELKNLYGSQNNISAANNATNQAVNRLEHVTEVTLTAAGWTGSAAPYSQTVTVPGATADMEPLLVSALPDGAAAATQKAYVKAFGAIACGTAVLGNGTATFKVYKKPVVDCTVGLKGV